MKIERAIEILQRIQHQHGASVDVCVNGVAITTIGVVSLAVYGDDIRKDDTYVDVVAEENK